MNIQGKKRARKLLKYRISKRKEYPMLVFNGYYEPTNTKVTICFYCTEHKTLFLDQEVHVTFILSTNDIYFDAETRMGFLLTNSNIANIKKFINISGFTFTNEIKEKIFYILTKLKQYKINNKKL